MPIWRGLKEKNGAEGNRNRSFVKRKFIVLEGFRNVAMEGNWVSAKFAHTANVEKHNGGDSTTVCVNLPGGNSSDGIAHCRECAGSHDPPHR